MRHILPFPNFNLVDRTAFFEKLMAGVLVQQHAWNRDPLLSGPADWQRFPCWFYAGKWTDGKGYKKVKFKGQTYYVHRAMFCLAVQVVPPDHLVDHLCKNPGCCQPHHLEAVPPIVNTLRGDNPNWLLRSRQIAPEWSVPAIMQAHIDHEHPCFRAPLMGAAELGSNTVDLQVGETVLQVEVPPEATGARERFVADGEQMLAVIARKIGEQPALACVPSVRVKYEFGVEADLPAPPRSIPNDLPTLVDDRPWLPRRLQLFLDWLWGPPSTTSRRPSRKIGEL